MIYLIPKKLHGKVKFGHNKLVICDGVQLTPEEEKFFKEYCKKHPLSIKDCI